FTSSAPLLRLPSANGDNPLAPLRILAYRGIYSKVTPWERQYPVEDLNSPFLDAANVGFLMREGPPLDDARVDPRRWQRIPISSDRPPTAYRNLAVLPRYRLVTDVRAAASFEEARKLLPSIDPRTAVVVEQSAAPAPSGPAISGSVTVKAYTPERAELDVDSPV